MAPPNHGLDTELADVLQRPNEQGNPSKRSIIPTLNQHDHDQTPHKKQQQST